MTTLAPTTPNRLKLALLIAPLAAGLGALGGLAASSPAFVLAGAAGGLVWTGLAVLLGTGIARLRDRVPAIADATALAAALAVMLTFGAGLAQHLMYPSPEAYLGLMRSPASGGATGLYMAVNPLAEWVLVPAALALSWRRARQWRLVLAAATVYYLQRLATYLYFAPTVLSWTEATGAVPPSQVGLWLTLDLARMALDLTVVVLLAAAALRSGVRHHAGRSA
ncbi:hypothetical protein [Thermoactinospora rubra]|uniref:hypothetical protein n=1 Tax=Thermoactinospora rubra TaxID=1088767 RepID=UPI000A11F0C3|nr:hypothetical protein [Thermoactinospora rubra]